MTVTIQFKNGSTMTFTGVTDDAILNQWPLIQLSGTHEGVTAGWVFSWTEVTWLRFQ